MSNERDGPREAPEDGEMIERKLEASLCFYAPQRPLPAGGIEVQGFDSEWLVLGSFADEQACSLDIPDIVLCFVVSPHPFDGQGEVTVRMTASAARILACALLENGLVNPARN
jgi:hypothetical protein